MPDGESVVGARRMPASSEHTGVLRIGVLVDLAWTETAGGHVKCWERIAEAAARQPGSSIDLTIHIQDRRARSVALAPHVRFVTHRPIMSTARFHALDVGADHTDLAPVHPALLSCLRRYDVIHTTDAYFAYAKSAALSARLWRKPLVTSLHTDTPAYTRIYSERILRRLLADGIIADWVVDRCALPDRLACGMRRRLARHIERSAWTLIGAQSDADLAELAVDPARSSPLRRGIDRHCFTPARRNRALLARGFGVPETAKLLLFVGRLDAAKGVRLLVEAAQQVIAGRPDIVVAFAGCGTESQWIAQQLGSRALLLGQLETSRLAEFYAASDLFVFPSEMEISPNVVLEAKASGAVCVVAPGGGGRFVRRNGRDGIIVEGRDPRDWADAICSLLGDATQRAEIGRAARLDIERRHPSWDDVFLEDLCPVWRAAASLGKRSGAARTSGSNVWHANPDSHSAS